MAHTSRLVAKAGRKGRWRRCNSCGHGRHSQSCASRSGALGLERGGVVELVKVLLQNALSCAAQAGACLKSINLAAASFPVGFLVRCGLGECKVLLCKVHACTPCMWHRTSVLEQAANHCLAMLCSEDAGSSDIFKAVLEAAHLRQLLRHKLLDKLGHGNTHNSHNAQQHLQHQQQPGGAWGCAGTASAGSEQRACGVRGDELWAAAGALLTPADLDSCRALARQRANRGLRRFMDGMHAEGWRTRTVLLSTAEKFRYLKLPMQR